MTWDRCARWMLGVGLVLLATPATAAPRGGGPGGRAAPVEVGVAETRTLQAGRAFLGDVEPSRRARVGGDVEGLVETFHADLGVRVEAEAPLATLRSVIIGHRLTAERAAWRARLGRLSELKAGARPEELRRATALVAQAKAALDHAEWTAGATRRLFEDGQRVSRDQLRDDELAVAEARAALDAEQASLDLLQAGTRAERIQQAEAEAAAQQAVVARLEEEERRHVIRAPFAGYVVAEHTEAGAWLRTGDAVVELAALDEVDVVVPVDEDLVVGLRTGTEVSFRARALPDRLLRGRILRIVPDAPTRTRAFPVRIRVTNEITDGVPLLRPG